MSQSQRIKGERDRLKLTQSACWMHCGVSRGTWIRWEAGAPVGSDKLELMAQLGFDVHYVIVGKRVTSGPVGELVEMFDKLTDVEQEELLRGVRSRAAAPGAVASTEDLARQLERLPSDLTHAIGHLVEVVESLSCGSPAKDEVKTGRPGRGAPR